MKTHAEAAAQLFNSSAFCKGARQQSIGLPGRLQTFRVKLCTRGHPVGPWELPSMLNQTVITNKSRSARVLWRAPELHHEGSDFAFSF